MARDQNLDETDNPKSMLMDSLLSVKGAKPKTMTSPKRKRKPEPGRIMPELVKTEASPETRRSGDAAAPAGRAAPKPKTQPRKKSAKPEPAPKVNRMRRKRTGRNIPFNQTVTLETANDFYAVQAEMGIPMGAVLEQAAKLLKKDLKKKQKNA